MNNFATLKPTCPFYPLFEGGLVPIVNCVVPNVVNCASEGCRCGLCM